MNKTQTLGDWCKWLERNFSPDVMIPKLPVIVRLDGNNFHNYTKGMDRPFDKKFSDCMLNTTKYLVEITNAVIGYTQSDEITLILYTDNNKSQIYNDGKKQKILSKLTGECVSYFNNIIRTSFDSVSFLYKTANFDCRIYQTPTLKDACNQLLWRELDATKNSISMLAQSLFSHKELQNLNGEQLQDKMMLEKNVNWNDLPTKFKRGRYVKRTRIFKEFTKEELENLPKEHNAHKNPHVVYERNVIEEIEYPIFSKIINKEDVIFNNEKPLIY